MNDRTCLALTLAAGLALAPPAAAAEENKESPFTVEFSAGAEYDSNVAVLELDTSSNAGDVAALIDLGLDFDKDLTRRLHLNVGYDFSQSLHEEFDAFDVRIHRGSTGLSYDFGRVKAGATLQYADAELDGDDFLVLKQASPYLSRLFGKRLFLRLGYTRTEKEFPGSPGRDATNAAPGVDAFVLLDGVKKLLTLSYQYQDEDALDDQFDYSGARIKTQLSRRFERGSRQLTLKASLRYESRQYGRGLLLPLGEPREDDRYRLETQLEVTLRRHGFLRLGYEYADNRSNLESVNFDEHVASIELGAKF